MKKQTCIKSVLWLLLIPMLFSSCLGNLEEYYKEPEWLKGSIYEVLQDKGHYSMFIKGVDRAGYEPMVNGKSILTVMAPSDSAITAYLTEHYPAGTTIENLALPELRKLIGFHILYYSFSKNMLTNFRPKEGDGATKDDKLINAGMYYKFRTNSQDSISLEKDTAGNIVSVFHQERFLPVFSYRMFQTKQIDAKTNYEYFFPNTPWKDALGFNVSNAGVNEYAVIADNGYVYPIDRVLKPLETIYTELSRNADYSNFLKLYDKYDYYQIENNLTLEYGNGTNLYQHYHSSPLPSIALEWPVTDYKLVSDLAYTSYSVFAPNNSALDGFFNDYWKVGGYDSLYQVSTSSIQYLLYNCFYSKSIVFPEEITKGLIENNYKTIIKFDVNAVPQANRKMCVNGSLYGCDVLTPPAMFGSVTGPAFQYKKFSYFLKMLTNADLVLTLCSDATKYIMLYPSNTVMNSTGITMNASETLMRGTTAINGSAQQSYVYGHVISLDGITGSYTALPTSSSSGNHVFRTLSPNMVLYWYMLDGKLTNSVKFNELMYDPNITEADVFCDLEELTFRDGWTNGKAYAYSNPKKSYLLEGTLDNAVYPKFVPMMLSNRNDATKMYYGFIQLLSKADMTDTETQSINAMIESCLMFIPTTASIKQAIVDGRIPGIKANTAVTDLSFFTNCTVTNLTDLQFYMKQYFIPLSTATMSNYPYVGWNEANVGGLMTLQSYDESDANGKVITHTTNMKVTDTGSKLSVQLVDYNGALKGNVVDVINTFHYFPFIFNDGCVHFIEDVL